MPSTVNGIGTHYYGKKYLKKRAAVCRQCGHDTELSSYETRLYFVVLFVPLIPLGRKRISDQCATCELHFVSAAHDWETGRQQVLALNAKSWREEPCEETGLNLHRGMLQYGEFGEADKVRKNLREKYSESAIVAVGLAEDLEQAGHFKDANPLWDLGFKLDPELPEAKNAMAMQHINDGKLDEARELLSYLSKPGAETRFNLNPVWKLAGAYQNKGKHKEVVDLLRPLIDRNPDMGRAHDVRAFVRKSEKAIGSTDSILPKLQHSPTKLFSYQYSSGFRWAIGIAAASLLFLTGMAFNNNYIRTHRPVTVFNATGVEAMVTIGDDEAVVVNQEDIIHVPEGTHEVKVTGPVNETYTLNVKSSGYFDRWAKTPVWIINVGREALLVESTLKYAVHPKPPRFKFYDEAIFYRKHIDFPFTEPAESVELDSKNDVETRTALEVWNLDGSNLKNEEAASMLYQQNPDGAFNFVARLASRNPTHIHHWRFLASYTEKKYQDMFEELIEPSLLNRPVNVEMHRLYQNAKRADDAAAIERKYDEFLAADPNNAKLLYLCSRIKKDRNKSHELRSKGLKLDPELGYLYLSRGYTYVRTGDFENAIQDLTKAAELGVPTETVSSNLVLAYLGADDFDGAEKFLRQQFSKPTSFQAKLSLAEVFAIKSDGTDRNYGKEYQVARRAFVNPGQAVPEEVLVSDAAVAYFGGDVEGALNLFSKTTQQQFLKMLEFEIGGMERLADVSKEELEKLPPICHVLFAIDDWQSGDKDFANIWLEAAHSNAKKRGDFGEASTELLSPETQITQPLVEELMQSEAEGATVKSAVLLISALRASDEKIKAFCLRKSDTMLVRRTPPYYFLRKALNAASNGENRELQSESNWP